MDASHQDLFGKTLGSLLPRDGFPVTLLPFLSGNSLSRMRERTKRKAYHHVCTLTLASIRREAEKSGMHSMEKLWTILAKMFLVYTSLALPLSWSFLSNGPQAFPQRQEERKGHKCSVDLNQYVCLNDWLAIYSTVMMSVVQTALL